MANSIKLIRIVYLVTCCRLPIIIGLMHLYVHFDELMGNGIKQYLFKEFTILSKFQPLWYTWGMTSFMMGIGFVVIGLLNSIFFMGLPKKVPPLNWSSSHWIALLFGSALCWYGIPTEFSTLWRIYLFKSVDMCPNFYCFCKEEINAR